MHTNVIDSVNRGLIFVRLNLDSVYFPDSNHLFGRRWHFVGTFVVPTSTNDVSTICHFAHRTNLIANRWFDVGPTPVARLALHMPT